MLKKFAALLLMLIVTIAVGAPASAAPDHVVTITDNSVTVSEQIVFDYQDISPGFSSDIPIEIVNNASEIAELRFSEITAENNDPNELFPEVNLVMLRSDQVILRSAPGGTTTDLINEAFCMPPNTTDDLVSHFSLPHHTTNTAQDTSLHIIYTLEITVGECNVKEPDPNTGDDETPAAPSTGFDLDSILSNPTNIAAIIGLGLIILIGLVILIIKFKNRKSKTKSADSRIKKSGPRLSRILANVFLALCLLILAGVVGLTIIAKQSGQAVSIAGFRPFVVASGSMEPTFQTNGFVITHDDNFNDVKVGDVVAFQSDAMNGQTALHRVITIVGDGDSKQFVVKGDNNPDPDGATVMKKNYLGRAVWHTNLSASYINMLNQPNGWITAIALPAAAIILIIIIISIFKKRRR